LRENVFFFAKNNVKRVLKKGGKERIIPFFFSFFDRKIALLASNVMIHCRNDTKVKVKWTIFGRGLLVLTVKLLP
jgi:hypothetical protein